jgi:glycosyltransferase involved in cell wall biosynthesis
VKAKRPLLLVSAWADRDLRAAVAAEMRPRPEYLELEHQLDGEVLDWSRLGRRGRRSPGMSLHHAAAAWPRVRDHSVVFSDGEHVGIPLALALALGPAHPHVVIGHWLTRRKKGVFFRTLKAHRRMTRIIVHSRTQLERATSELGIPRDLLQFAPYCADTKFWRPLDVPEESVIMSAGREQRDYAILDRACTGLGQQLLIAAGSLYSPNSACTLPPPTSTALVRQVDYVELREWYARATVVVVPLLPNDFQAGVTTLLEAMAMEKAVVVSATDGQRDIVVDGETGILVPPGDEKALREAVERLLKDPSERKRLGRNARRAVSEHFSLDRYVDTLSANLREATA